MRALMPAGTLTDQSVIVGHSQGGHVALSAQSYAETYGLDGELAGVAAFSPFWITMRAWGALLHPVSGLTPANAGTFYMYALYYFYTNGQAADGAAGRLTPFVAAKQAAVDTFMQTRCHGEAITALPTELGATTDEIFDPAWRDPVSTCGFDLGACAGNPTSALWASRWATARPALSPTGAPVVVWGGRNDTAITPARLQCALDKFSDDLGAELDNIVTVCGDDNAAHSTIMVQEGATWVSSWIAARAAGGPAPAACPGVEALSSGTLACDMTFPNTD
jgi:pimeloyl-ACP methyl ester carboxylesterase